MPSFDVYAYGMVASSTLHVLKSAFPAPDGYAEILGTYDNVGGEAANTAIVLARLDLRVKLDGVHLPADQGGRRTRQLLQNNHVHIERLKLNALATAPREMVFAGGGARTLFANYGAFARAKRAWNPPRVRDIAFARMVCLDPFLKADSRRAAAAAVRFNVPYVTVDCAPSDILLRHAAATIISSEFRQRRFPRRDPKRLLTEYAARAEGLVVLTFGAEAVRFKRGAGVIQSLNPPRVKAIDTSGAGDAFRAGVIYGLLQGWTDRDVIRFAAALAALVCRRFPGVLNSPSLADVLRLAAL